MGNCSSCKFMTSNCAVTAKLILPNGELEEYSCPVKASEVLLHRNSGYFLCNSDEMDFDEFVSAVDEDEELRPGQLYFVLAASWLGQRLQAQDMAALAFKASLVLKGRGGEDEYDCGCWRSTATSGGVVDEVDPLMFSCEIKDDLKLIGQMVVEKKNRRRGHGGGAKFARTLSIIVEE